MDGIARCCRHWETKVQQTRHTLLFIASESADIELAHRTAESCSPDCELQVIENVDVASDSLACATSGQLPSLVLMDLQLPKLQGLAVLRKLRLHPITLDLPVLVHSIAFTQADVLLAYRAGVNCFVAKPLNEAQFIELFSAPLFCWRPSERQQLSCATQ